VSSLDRILHRIAQFGVVVFVICYSIAIPMYPGGSPFDRSHPGYDLADNYLCDAFRARAYDGRLNMLGARIGQVGMFGLVLAASAALLAVPGSFRRELPRLSRFARFVAVVAFAGMLLVPLTPAHQYGVLHFAAVGIGAVPSLMATYVGAYGLSRVVLDEQRFGRILRIATLTTLVACTLHFAQYAAQAAHWVGEGPWTPRLQKLVVAMVVTWILVLTFWALAAPRDMTSVPNGGRSE
jgi:hypothetical protein